MGGRKGLIGDSLLVLLPHEELLKIHIKGDTRGEEGES